MNAAPRFMLIKLESLDSNMGSYTFAAALLEVHEDLQARIDQAHALILANPGINSIGLNVMVDVLAGESYLEGGDVEAEGDEFEAMSELIGKVDIARYVTLDEAERLRALSVSNAEGPILSISAADAPEFRCYVEGALEHFACGNLDLLRPTALRRDVAIYEIADAA